MLQANILSGVAAMAVAHWIHIRRVRVGVHHSMRQTSYLNDCIDCTPGMVRFLDRIAIVRLVGAHEGHDLVVGIYTCLQLNIIVSNAKPANSSSRYQLEEIPTTGTFHCHTPNIDSKHSSASHRFR